MRLSEERKAAILKTMKITSDELKYETACSRSLIIANFGGEEVCVFDGEAGDNKETIKTILRTVLEQLEKTR